MIRKLMRLGVTLALYFCIATFLAQVIFFGYCSMTWKVDRGKVVQALAVLQDIDLFAMKKKVEARQTKMLQEQPSYEQVVQARAAKGHHLQLRMTALKSDMDQIETNRRTLAEERQKYDQLRATFNTELADIQESAASEGMEDNIAKLMALKGPQAKQILLDMMEKDEMDDVVALLMGMPTTNSTKIIKEFKTDKEMDDIGEVLRLIRQGAPVAVPAIDTQQELQDLGISQN